MARAAKPQGSPKGELAKAKREAVKPHELLLMPVAQNAIAMDAWGKYVGEVDLSELVTGLQEQTDKVRAGNMGSVESMLYGQATTLQTIFTNLARRSAMNAGEYIDAADKYMRLALKAQSQCRATLETLADIKNPMPYIKQANISNGHQQVNNGAIPEQYAQARAHTEDSQTTPNKLLEANHGQRLDIGAQAATGRANQRVEAVGAVHRA